MPHYFLQAGKHITRLGDRIVKNYENSSNKWPGGDCFAVAYERARIASKQVADTKPIMAFDRDRIFCKFWGSLIVPLDAWLKTSGGPRGKGAPGAMEWDGRGKCLDADLIWAGALEPGAVIQVWTTRDDFNRVRNGQKPQNDGHSFFHLRYVEVGSAIVGMKVIDQGFHRDETVMRGRWGVWFGANMRCMSAVPPSYSEPDPYLPQPYYPSSG